MLLLRIMGHKHQATLSAVFHDPVSGNIHWREVEAMLKSIGADVQPGHGARMRVILNGIEGTLHRPHHSSVLTKQDVRHLREFLASAGVSSD